MVINDYPASGGPETPATSVASKRAPPTSPGVIVSKRSRLNTPPVVATQAAAPARIVSLRDCETEQVIDNKTVSRIDVVGWCVDMFEYKKLNCGSLFTDRFDKDYLSTDLHRSEWGKLLRLREKGVATQCCVNDTVMRRAKKPGKRTHGMYEACDRCVKTNRLCARLVETDGVIKLAFFPLPGLYLEDAQMYSMDYWVI